MHGFDWDVYLFTEWAVHIFKHGLPQAYDAEINTYMPLYQYVLYGFGKLCGSEEAIRQNFNYSRIVTLFFDFAGLWYVYKWIDKRVGYHFLVLLGMLNVAYSYNTVIWGQVDAVSSGLAFISIYYGFNKKPLASALFLLLALNMKLQMIVFVPIWGLLYLYNIIETRSWKTFLFPLLVLAIGQVILLTPFMFYEKGLEQVYNAVFTSVGQFPKVSAFAFNMWYWICPQGPVNVLDSEIFIMGLSYKHVGLLLFFCSSFLVMLPLITGVLKRLSGKSHLWPLKQHLWLVCALIPLFFFFFNTQMHERYCHPAFIFITASAFFTGYWLPYIFFSVAYLLNLERVMMSLGLNNYSVFVFDGRFVAALYAIAIVLLLAKFVRTKVDAESNVGLRTI